MNEQTPDPNAHFYIECVQCGMCLSSMMFREYENGTEWLNMPCCE